MELNKNRDHWAWGIPRKGHGGLWNEKKKIDKDCHSPCNSRGSIRGGDYLGYFLDFFVRIGDVRSSDCEIDKPTHKTSISSKIKNWIPRIIG